MRLAFIGGGNMARAIIGGLRATLPAQAFTVVEPLAAPREALARDFGVDVHERAGTALQTADVVVWAVKPQSFVDAAAACREHVGPALQLSVMAGIRSDAIVRATGTPRVVRAMPNTPALIGRGIAGLHARPEVDARGKAMAERVMAPTGQWIWFDDESKLDAVTAMSGSGPAYVFYVIEAMVAAGERIGLSATDARRLALVTLEGATALAMQSDEPVGVLRERVTSKGGTTHAALQVLGERGVREAFEEAIAAAHRRAKELGDAFG